MFLSPCTTAANICVYILGYFKLESPVLQQHLHRKTDNMRSGHMQVSLFVCFCLLVCRMTDMKLTCCDLLVTLEKQFFKKTLKFFFLIELEFAVIISTTLTTRIFPIFWFTWPHLIMLLLFIFQGVKAALGRVNKATEYSSSSDEVGSSDDEERNRW